MFPTFPSSPPSQLWDEFLNSDPLQKSLILKVYNKLLSYDSSPATKVKAAWERELGLLSGVNLWQSQIVVTILTHIFYSFPLLFYFQQNYLDTMSKNIFNNYKCLSPFCHLSRSFRVSRRLHLIHLQAIRYSSFHFFFNGSLLKLSTALCGSVISCPF